MLAKNKLRAKIIEVGYSQSDVADEIGISKTAFSNKINDKCDFTLTEIQKICNLLNLNEEERHTIFLF